VRNDTDLSIRTLRIPPRRSFEGLGDSIFYVDLFTISYAEFLKQLPLLQTAHGIVVDMRGYPSDDALEVFSHFINKPTPSTKQYVPMIIYPDHQNASYDSSLTWTLLPRSPRLNCKLTFLIDNGCISAAEEFLSIAQHYKLGDLVGQPSAGADGNINQVKLPGNYSVMFTGMRVRKQDGTRLHGVGINPTTLVRPTIRGVKNQKDETLERAFQILKNRR
jgi:C-terminal processing protease CtpA/Prc